MTITPKRHDTNKAARDFLRGISFTSPNEAIAAGVRSEEQYQTFMLGRAARFWRENGAKVQRKVRKRHPVKRVRRKKGVDWAQSPKFHGEIERIRETRENIVRLLTS